MVDALDATVAVGVVGARRDFAHTEELVHGIVSICMLAGGNIFFFAQNVRTVWTVWRGGSLVGGLMWPWRVFGQFLVLLMCSAFWQ